MVISTRTLALSATGLVAVVAGTIGLAHARPPMATHTPPAVYGLDPASPPDDPAVLSEDVQSKRVSANFVNAPITQVLAWLGKQDANFVVASSSLPADLKITLNVKDEPLASVEKAIASAMGGAWSTRDGIMVFRKGMNDPFAIADMRGANEMFNLKGMDGMKELKGLQDFKFLGQDGKGFQFNGKDLKDLKGLPNGMQFKELPGGGFQFWTDAKTKAFEFNPKDFEKLQNQFGPDFQKKMQNQFGPDFQKKLLDKGDMLRLDGGKGNLFLLQDQNLTGLMKSLTPDQRATMKKRGYLTPKDLDAKQLKMLGTMKGKFEVKVQNDKDSMTIKSE